MKKLITIFAVCFISGILKAQDFNVKHLEKLTDIHYQNVDDALKILKALNCKCEDDKEIEAPDDLAINNFFYCVSIQDEPIRLAGMMGKIVSISGISLNEKHYETVEKMLLRMKNYTSNNQIEEITKVYETYRVKIFKSKKEKRIGQFMRHTNIYLHQPEDGKFVIELN